MYGDVELRGATRDWMVGTAARYEHFADFGATLNGKLSARVPLTGRVALRGSLGTGFRAPTPGQQNAFYYGGWYDRRDTHRYRGKPVVDLELAWPLRDTVALAVGARNALDTYPDMNPNAGRLGNRYPPSTPFGFDGRFYYTRLDYRGGRPTERLAARSAAWRRSHRLQHPGAADRAPRRAVGLPASQRHDADRAFSESGCRVTFDARVASGPTSGAWASCRQSERRRRRASDEPASLCLTHSRTDAAEPQEVDGRRARGRAPSTSTVGSPW